MTSHIHSWALFWLWFHLFILSQVISPFFSSNILGTYQPGGLIFGVISFCLFVLFMVSSRQEFHWVMQALSPQGSDPWKGFLFLWGHRSQPGPHLMASSKPNHLQTPSHQELGIQHTSFAETQISAHSIFWHLWIGGRMRMQNFFFFPVIWWPNLEYWEGRGLQ